MGSYKIKQIGIAKNHVSKSGNKCMKLKFYENVFENIAEHDFKEKIYIMENGNIIAPMPNETKNS